MADYRVKIGSNPTELDNKVATGPAATHYVDTSDINKAMLHSKPTSGALTLNTVSYVPNFTNVVVVEENAGPQGDFHKIYLVVYSENPNNMGSVNYDELKKYTIVYKGRTIPPGDLDRAGELFLPAVILKKLDDNEEVDIPEVILPPAVSKTPPGEDWRTNSTPVIWNKQTNEYWVTVKEHGDPAELVPDGWSDMDPDRLESIKKTGVLNLLTFLGFSLQDISNNQSIVDLLPKTPPEQKKCYIPQDAAEHKEAPGFYEDQSLLKWLVIIKGGIIEAIPRTPYDFSKVVDNQSVSPFRAIMKMSDFPKYIKRVANTFDEIHTMARQSQMDLGDFNPEEEAKRLRKVPKAVTDLLALDPNLKVDANDFNQATSQDKFIEFGFSGTYEITYILVTRRTSETHKVSGPVKEKVVPLIKWTAEMNEKFKIGVIDYPARTGPGASGYRKPGDLVSVQDPMYRKWYFSKNDKYPDKETIKEINRDRWVTTSTDTGDYIRSGVESGTKVRMTPVKIGFNLLSTGVFYPLDAVRTACYLYYLVPMNDDAKSSTTGNWIDFVHAYTYPTPEIRPSYDPDTQEVESGKFMGVSMSVVMDKIPEEPDEYEAIQEKLDDPDLKEQLAKRRDSVSDFIGDLQLQDLSGWLDMNTTRWDLDSFPQLLYKMPPEHLISIAISCLAPNLTLQELLKALCEAALAELPPDVLASLILLLDSGYRQGIIDKLGPAYIKSWIDDNVEPKSPILAEKCREIYRSEIEAKIVDPLKERVGPDIQSDMDEYGEKTAEQAYFYYNPGGKPNPGDENNPGEFLRAAILDTVDSENLCFLLMGLVKELWDLLKQLLAFLGAINWRSIKFDLDIDLEIDDNMAWIYKMLKQMMIVLIWEAIMYILKFILQSIIDACESLRNWAKCEIDPDQCPPDAENMNDQLGADPDAFAKGLDTANKFGIPPNLTGDFGGIPYEEFGKQEGALEGEKSLADVFDVLQDVLTLGEYCTLINGTASSNTLIKIRDFLQNTSGYSAISVHLNDLGKINDFFVAFGGIIDTGACDIIPAFVNQNRSVSNLCKDVFDAIPPDDTLSGQASLRDDNKTKDLIKDLARIFLKDDFSDLLPPISCAHAAEKDPKSSLPSPFAIFDSASLVPKDPPSVKHLNDMVINSAFEGIKVFFNTELIGFKSALLRTDIVRVSKLDDDIRLKAWDTTSKVWGTGYLDKEDRGYFSDYDLVKDQEMWASTYTKKGFFSLDQFNNKYPAFGSLSYDALKTRGIVLGPWEDANGNGVDLPDNAPTSDQHQLKQVHPDNQRDGYVSSVAKNLRSVFDNPADYIDIKKKTNSSTFDISDPRGQLGVRLTIKKLNQDEVNPLTLKCDLVVTPSGAGAKKKVYPFKRNYNFSSQIIDDYISEIRTDHPTRDIFWKLIKKSIHKDGTANILKVLESGEPNSATMRWYFNKEAYNLIVRAHYTSIMRNIQKSQYFDPNIFNAWKIIPDSEAQGGTKATVDLLGVASIKDLIQEKYDSLPCKRKEDVQHPMEKSLSLGFVVMLMRLFIVEYALENLFMASTYYTAEHFLKSENFITFIGARIRDGLDKFGDTYERARDEIYDSFISQISAGGKLIDPWTNNPVELGHGGTREEAKNHSVELIIKTQVPDVVDNMNRLLARHNLVNDLGSIEEAFLYGLKMLDVPLEPGSLRFTTITEGTYGAPAPHDDPDYHWKKYGMDFPILTFGAAEDHAGFTTLAASLAANAPRLAAAMGPYVNGQFILERYIRVDGSLLAQKPALFKDTYEDSGVVNLDTWAKWLQNIPEIKSSLPSDDDIEKMFSAVNPDTGEEIKGWSFGLRLCYVPPLENNKLQFLVGHKEEFGTNANYLAGINVSTGEVTEVFDSSDWESVHANFRTFFEKKLYTAFAASPRMPILDADYQDTFEVWTNASNAQKKEKSWKMKEQRPWGSGALQKDVGSGTGTASQNVYVIPIAYAEMPFLDAYKTYRQSGAQGESVASSTKDNYKLGNLKDILNKAGLTSNDLEKGSMQQIYKSGAQPLLQKLLANEKLQLMLSYAMPLSEIATSQSIYNMLRLRESERLEDAFDETKAQIIELWKTTNDQPATKPYWKYKSSALTAEESDTQMKNTQTTSGPSSSKIGQMMAKMTIPMIIRGLAEQIDPCIRSMKADDVEQDWSSIFPAGPVTPVTMFGIFPFGFGTWAPITPLGMVALSMPKPGKGTTATKKAGLFDADNDQQTDFDETEYMTNAGWATWFD